MNDDTPGQEAPRIGTAPRAHAIGEPAPSAGSSGAGRADPGVIDTPATRAVRSAGIPFDAVQTEPPRDPEESARLQGIVLRSLLRSIVVRRGEDDYVFVLVPAGRRFDWPKLRAFLGVNRLSLPDQEEAKAVTGYERGAITPFGATHAWPVIADASIMDLPRIAIGGGRRGLNLHLSPADLVRATGADVADVTSPEEATD